MTNGDRAKRAALGRSLLVGALVFAVVFLSRRYLVPPLPVPYGPLVAALIAGAAAVAGWWIVFRWWARRAAGRGVERTGAERTAQRTLLIGSIVLILYPVFRLWLLPLLPGAQDWLDGVFGAALAGGLAGGVAAWVAALHGRPEAGARSVFRTFLLSCAAAALLGGRFEAAAAPIPVADLVEGFNPAFAYFLSPDGRFVLRRDRRSFGLEMYPIGANGGVGAPVDLGRHRTGPTVWSRDGGRLYGIRYRKRTPLLLVIDPDRPRAKPREVSLDGISGRVVGVHRHPARANRLVLWTFGREGQAAFHCGVDEPGCESVSAAGGGWLSILGRDGRPAVRHRFRDGRREVEARIGEAWKAVGEAPVDRILQPLSLIDAEGWGLALSNHTLDTTSLVRWNARTLEERPVLSTPEANLFQALLSESGEPLAATSFPGYPRTTALHPAVERVLALVRARHPGPSLVNVAAADAALQRFVIEVFDEESARVAYLVALPGDAVEAFDRSPAGRFREDFSPTRAIRIPARDGLALPALLTVPRDREGSSDPPPLVLMVHGGPWLHYRWTFDPLVQLLASRGYTVLKLNYRGSAGYGNRFREAAVGELAGRVQDDVEDAAEWAVREGYADPSRLVVYGDSFGGFSVLTAMVRGRAPVRAGVVLNGVVDTEAMVRENTFSAEGWALWAKYLGTSDVDEMRRTLREASPLRNVDAIRAPVLFVVGNADQVVQARHAEALVDELRSRGRTAELLAFPRERHSIVKPANVVRTYREIVRFLDRHVN